MTDEKDLIRERKKKLENISEFSLAYPNKVIKSDTVNDLAIIKIVDKNFSRAKFGFVAHLAGLQCLPN